MAASSQPGFGDVSAIQKLERRSCARVSVLEELQQAVFAELGPTRGLLLDVCAGGIAVEAVDAIKKDVRLPVSFSLPFDHDLYQASCEVVWENGGRTGLKFVPADRGQGQLRRWLDTYGRVTAGRGKVAIDVPLPGAPQHTNYDLSDAVASFNTANLPASSRIEARIIARALPECDLSRVTEEARSLTRADGAAIALRDEQGVICRASSGSAPSVGFRLRPEIGITGECLRTGEVVWCDEMEDDPRVDRAIAQRLQSRSAVVVPIAGSTPRAPVAGAIVVLSSRSFAFSSEHVAILQQFANQVGSAWSIPDTPTHEDLVTAQQQESAVAFADSSASVPAGNAEIESFPTGPVIETEATDDSGVGNCHDNEPALQPIATIEAIRKFLAADDKEPAPKASTAVDAARRSLSSLTGAIKGLGKQISGRRSAVGLVLPIAAGSLLLWWFFHAQKRIAAEQTHFAAQQTSQAMLQPVSSKAVRLELPVTEESARTVTSGATAAHNHSPSKQSEKQVVKAKGPVRQLAIVQPQASDAEAPQLALASAASLPELSKPTPSPVSPPISQFVPAQLVYRAPPVYPEAARRWQRSEKVVLKATITKNGAVGNVHWVEGNAIFRDNSISAVQQWRYKPANLDGQPVESEVEIVLRFGMSAR